MAKRKNDKKHDLVKMLKRHSRNVQLERERLVGKARPKTYGGKPPTAKERRQNKEKLRKLDNMDETM